MQNEKFLKDLFRTFVSVGVPALLTLFLFKPLMNNLGGNAIGQFIFIVSGLVLLSIFELVFLSSVKLFLTSSKEARSKNFQIRVLEELKSKSFRIALKTFFLSLFLSFSLYFVTVPSDKVNLSLSMAISSLYFLLTPFRLRETILEVSGNRGVLVMLKGLRATLFILASFALSFSPLAFLALPLSLLISSVVYFFTVGVCLNKELGFEKVGASLQNSPISLPSFNISLWPNSYVLTFLGSFLAIILFVTSTPTSLAQFVVSSFFLVVIFVFTTFLAKIFDSHESESSHNVSEDAFKRSVNVSAFLLMVFIAPIFGMNEKIITLWLNNSLYAGDSFTFLILFVALFGSVLPILRKAFRDFPTFFEKGILFCSLIIFAILFSITGDLKGPLFSLLIVGVALYALFSYKFKVELKQGPSLLLNWLWTIPFMAILAIISKNIVVMTTIDSFLKLLFFYPLNIFLNVFILQYLFLTKNDRAFVYSKARELLSLRNVKLN